MSNRNGSNSRPAGTVTALGKICTFCEIDKPLDAFRAQVRGKLGRTARCSECLSLFNSELKAKHYAENRESILAGHKANQPHRTKVQRKYSLKHHYGMTVAEYEAMIESQGGQCAICGTRPQTLVVDHCHETGNVRGLLCGKCNTGIGMLQDSADVAMAAVAYLLGSINLLKRGQK